MFAVIRVALMVIILMCTATMLSGQQPVAADPGGSTAIAYGQLSFCDGWVAGYKAGYCYQDRFCMAPLPPLCPLPNLGEDSYEDGYNRGFLKGLADR